MKPQSSKNNQPYGMLCRPDINQFSLIPIIAAVATVATLCLNNRLISDKGHLRDSLAGTDDGRMPESKSHLM